MPTMKINRPVIGRKVIPRWPNKVIFELECGHRLVCDKTVTRIPRNAKVMACYQCAWQKGKR